MDAQLAAFRDQGLADGIATMGHDVTVTTTPSSQLVLSGIRSELQVDPGSLKPGGFQYKRAFQLRVPLKRRTDPNDPSTETDVFNLVKVGMTAVDANGHGCKIVRFDVGHNSVVYIFGSANS